MGPKEGSVHRSALSAYPLAAQINLKHPLVRLSEVMNWERIEKVCALKFSSKRGRPASAGRLIAGLLYLEHAFGLSDEEVVWGWVENPYWQFFTGETVLQTEAPIDPSSLTRWRHRLDEAGVEELLAVTIEAGKRIGVLSQSDLKAVIVDSTVQPKAVAYPTDSRLLERSRQHLVKAAQRCGIKLRQNYNWVAPKLAIQIGRYAHARQFKRMKKTLRKLRTRVGRVWRDITRQVEQISVPLRAWVNELLARTRRILDQRPKDKNKLYALHAPEVECLCKGKTRTPYEFGVKVSIATPLNQGFIVGARSMPGNPYDGHTLAETLEQVSILTEVPITTAVVDRGYRGVSLDGVRILHSGQKRGVTKSVKKMIKRRSAIEPTIGHMKADGKLGCNWLKGEKGDAIHAVLCGVGHNIRLLLRHLWPKRLLTARAARLCSSGLLV